MRGIWRFPDKPTAGGSVDGLQRVEDRGGAVCQQKIDGQRMLINRSGAFTQRGHRVELPEGLAREVAATLACYPEGGVTLDGEYLPESRGGPALYLFDLLEFGGFWIGRRAYSDRRSLLEVAPSEFILRPREVFSGFAEFYEANRGVCEGVVVKCLRSPTKCTMRTNHVNPDWLKVRYDQEGTDHAF